MWSLVAQALLLVAPEVVTPEWRQERTEDRQPVPADLTSLTIENPLGNIAVRSGGHDEVKILAHRQWPDDAERPRFDLELEGDRLSIRVPGSVDGGSPGDRPGPRLDLSLLVPERLALSLSTVDGDVEIRGAHGPLEISSSAGDIRTPLHGAVRAHTDLGEISALLEPAGDLGGELSTRSGAVRLWLVEPLDLTLELRTAGPITTDYSIIIDRSPGQPVKSGVIRLGEGAARLLVETETGSISVLQR